MKKVTQSKLHDPEKGIKGNCLAACVASIFETELSEVPAFEEAFEDGSWLQLFERFLNARGYQYNGCLPFRGDEYASFDIPEVNGCVMIYGESPRSPKVLHAVVSDRKMNIIHDPHPSNDGLVEIHGCYMIEKE